MRSRSFSPSPFIINILPFFLIFNTFVVLTLSTETVEPNEGLFKVEGKAVCPTQYTSDDSWTQSARVLLDGGVHIGIVKPDGQFVVNGIESGSYVVEVSHPHLAFEPLRVEVNSKGKVRARELDNVQPFQVKNVLTYPLKMSCRGKFQYFQQREQWRISDLLFSPMVLMMVLPVVMMFIIPKLMNSQDPEVQKEMQQSMSWMTPKSNMPDLSEMITSWLGSKTPPSSSSSKKSTRAKIKQK